MRSPVVNLLLQSDLATNFVGVYVSPNRLSPDGLYYYISYLERDIISITVKSCELSHVCVGGGGTVSTASSSLDYFVCGNKLRAICQQKRHHHLPTGWVDPIWGTCFLFADDIVVSGQPNLTYLTWDDDDDDGPFFSKKMMRAAVRIWMTSQWSWSKVETSHSLMLDTKVINFHPLWDDRHFTNQPFFFQRFIYLSSRRYDMIEPNISHINI